jgi:assimilatory nitrate reductase catalytic subunit
MHWNGQVASDAGIAHLIAPATDPISGQPELKHTTVMISPMAVAWQAQLFCRREIDPTLLGEGIVWARSQGIGHLHYTLAGSSPIEGWATWLDTPFREIDRLEYIDRRLGLYRRIGLADGTLEAALFIAPAPLGRTLDWITELFSDPTPLDRRARTDLLAGTRAQSAPDCGPIVCACHGVGKNAILSAIDTLGLATVEELGQHLRAGTNCGSCIPELQGLLRV